MSAGRISMVDSKNEVGTWVESSLVVIVLGSRAELVRTSWGWAGPSSAKAGAKLELLTQKIPRG